MKKLLLPIIAFVLLSNTYAQQSVARKWNEAMLNAIRHNFAKPTIHARNLFHVSMVMYDAWAAYDTVAKPYLLGDTVAGFICPFTGVPIPSDPDTLKAYREKAISYAAYRLLMWRYTNRLNASCPNAPLNRPLSDTVTIPALNALFLSLGYDTAYHGDNYANGNPADLGNYIAEQAIAYGLQDGANEACGYSNQFYAPINPPLVVKLPGNPDMTDPNRWQPLSLDYSVDQNGQVLPGGVQGALSPEWGNVVPFGLPDSVKTTYSRGGHNYDVWEDPGPPPYMDTVNGGGLNDPYKWSHTLVATWSSHLDPTDSVMWDISPAHIGNVQSYPTNVADYPNFYDILNGGDPGTGYTVNPKTGQPYAPQIVPRGDYVRVLAEFWADGPNSETPPGHWFTILNYVNDHPQFSKRWGGKGPVMDDLEWDVKAYFTLGGAVHDAAITSWGIKGWYDYARPISAIRFMAREGQSSDTSLANYSPKGIPLIPGYVEVIQSGDPLDSSGLHTGEIKVKAWKGSNYVSNPDTDVAGVDWILAANWVPYQRPTFVTPPFPGYTSGHSTYSRTAAEVMTRITGDPYFPGGMGTFPAPQNQYLVFEDGPSVSLTLQWAKYVDASDQCSLSRIWGGIHPPADDMPGRLAGMKLGPTTFRAAQKYFDSEKPMVESVTPSTTIIADADAGTASFSLTVIFNENMDTSKTPSVLFPVEDPLAKTLTFNAVASGWTNWTTYNAKYDVADSSETLMDIDVSISEAKDVIGNSQEQFNAADNFSIDTRNPVCVSVVPSATVISDSLVGTAAFSLTVTFDEAMDIGLNPTAAFPIENPLAKTLTLNSSASSWMDSVTFLAVYDVADSSETLSDVDVQVSACYDAAGNSSAMFNISDNFSIDTKNPNVMTVTPNLPVISKSNTGTAAFILTIQFDENMSSMIDPAVSFPAENPLAKTLTLNTAMSGWTNTTTYEAKYDVVDSSESLPDIDVRVDACLDEAGNAQVQFNAVNKFSIEMLSVGVSDIKSFNLTKVYPNPAKTGDLLVIDFGADKSDISLRLYDMLGQKIAEERKSSGKQLAEISTKGLSTGLYLLQIKGNTRNETVRIQVSQ